MSMARGRQSDGTRKNLGCPHPVHKWYPSTSTMPPRQAQAAASFQTRESPSMKANSSIYRVRTLGVHDLVDVTEKIEQAVAAAEISAGRVIVSAPGSGCAIVVNERE